MISCCIFDAIKKSELNSLSKKESLKLSVLIQPVLLEGHSPESCISVWSEHHSFQTAGKQAGHLRKEP